MDLRPDEWTALADGNNLGAVDALSRLPVLIAVARQESELDSVELDAVHDEAPADIAGIVIELHATRLRAVVVDGGTAAPPGRPVGKVGRNEPCPCGSGKKFKRCCG